MAIVLLVKHDQVVPTGADGLFSLSLLVSRANWCAAVHRGALNLALRDERLPIKRAGFHSGTLVLRGRGAKQESRSGSSRSIELKLAQPTPLPSLRIGLASLAIDIASTVAVIMMGLRMCVFQLMALPSRYFQKP